MKKVLIIIPYFGCFPEWIDLFFFSCKKNPYIDFLLYTDCAQSSIDANVRIVNINYIEYCNMVSQKFNITFCPSNKYKLVDLKPFLGILHENDLSPYDFWGFGDLDLVYGDLRIILNDKRLLRYDLFTTHSDRCAGHFTVIKVKSKYTKFCLKFKDKLADEHIYGLDECDFTWMARPMLKYFWVLHRFFRISIPTLFSIPSFFERTFTRKYIKEFKTSPMPHDNQMWKYDINRGKILDPNSDELPYLHFLFFKKNPYWSSECYWKDKFWQVGNLDYSNIDGFVCIDNQKVKYIKQMYT